jgi:hypothetical protein
MTGAAPLAQSGRSRAQEMCFQRDIPDCDSEKKLGLYLRYQTTHDGAFHKYFDQLLKHRAETRKQGIGFESQKATQADQARKQETHAARVRVANAKADAGA